MRLPDELKHASGGEQVDELAHGVLRLAHEAIERFPDVKRRHMFMASGAAISSALVVAAGVAITRRVRAGQQPEEAAQEVTEDEIEGLRLVERQPYRPNADRSVTEDTADGDAADPTPSAPTTSDIRATTEAPEATGEATDEATGETTDTVEAAGS